MSKRFTPPELAKLWRVKPDKIIGFIRSGELQAFDVANRGSRRPRYLISEEAIETFELRRSVQPAVRVQRHRRRRDENIIEFFK